jgi:hypothetical protein
MASVSVNHPVGVIPSFAKSAALLVMLDRFPFRFAPASFGCSCGCIVCVGCVVVVLLWLTLGLTYEVAGVCFKMSQLKTRMKGVTKGNYENFK